ncbi:MAG TPA: tetratricopeptide repeat protein [Vicinamibacterales bacterium]|nr:tetratricopeptide repeat protein [Vicinamibacterales bacterium]
MRRTTLILALILGFGIGPAVHAQDKAATTDRFQSLMGLARVKRNAGDIAGARRYFEDARRVRPFDAQELTEYFWILAGHDSAAALVVGREVLTVTPDARNVRDRVITEAIAVADEATVRHLATEGARLQPATALWPRRLGESHLRQGQPREAAEAFARAVRAADAIIDDRAGLALSLEGAKRYAESVAAWRDVPPPARAGRIDWEKSRLRAIAAAAAPLDAAEELETWLDAHPDDDAARDLLVSVYIRAKQPGEALKVLKPVTADERRLQAELFVESRQYAKAASAVRSMAPKSGRCDVRLLTLADRLPDPTGTDLLTDLMTRPGCNAPASWIRRGAERHVAVSNHQSALTLLKTLPAAELEQPGMVRLAGQVHVWTGDLPEGIRLLERAVKTSPDDQAAQRTLAEARQALSLPVAGQSAIPVSTARPISYAPPSDSTDVAPAPAAPIDTRPANLKRRADELSWSGHHAEAIRTYDAYLALMPGDLDVMRQQARVAGWSGQYGLSRRLYARAQVEAPGHAAIAAEAAAKSAFYSGRWRASADAYARWIALEPEASEARFEYAESLRADGRIAEADAALQALILAAHHDQAIASFHRAQALRGPSVSLVTNGKSADGYQGQRLLDLSEYGGALRASFGDAGTTSLSAQGTRVRASGDQSARNGYAAGVTGTAAVSRAFSLDGRVTVWDLAASGSGIVDALARAAWRPADRWTLAVGARQEPLFENMTTVDRGLTAVGGFASATFDSPRTWFNLQFSQQSVSDDNERTRATLTFSRALSDRLRRVRVVGWAEWLRYQSSSPDYFSPSGQVRVDLGVEYTHAFRAPQFRGDRQQTFTAGYLIGTDNDGEVYHHPLARLSFEIGRGVAIDGQANWIRSDVYRETSAFVGLRLTGQTFGW